MWIWILVKYSFTTVHHFPVGLAISIVVKLSVWFNCAIWIRAMLLDNAANNTIFVFINYYSHH